MGIKTIGLGVSDGVNCKSKLNPEGLIACFLTSVISLFSILKKTLYMKNVKTFLSWSWSFCSVSLSSVWLVQTKCPAAHAPLPHDCCGRCSV